MGFAFMTFWTRKQKGVTVELKMNYLKPVQAGNILYAYAFTPSQGKSIYFLECEIRNSSQELVAKACGTYKIVKGRSD